MEFTIHVQVLLTVFVMALVMGAVVYKTNFCTMGGVSDWVNMGDTGRMRAWMFAMTIALAGVTLMEYLGVISLGTNTFPPYRTPNFAWLRYILGGVLFGIGMTLASGCAQRTLVRAGGGNLKSVFVIAVAGFAAYMMLWGEDPLNPGEGFFTNYFLSWIQPTIIDLSALGIESQALGAILGGAAGMEETQNLHYLVAAVVVVVMLAVVFASRDFRSRFDNLLGGGVVGLAVVGGWYVTAGAMGTEWKEYTEFLDEIPSRVAAQSYTFVSPLGDGARYALNPTKLSFINFGVMAALGVLLGALIYSVAARRFRIEWFASFTDFLRHLFGALLMGVGGVLAMGCTVGQGITGVSTLALGSVLALLSIIFGAALTMKVEYYRMVYEDQAGFFAALVTALVDMRLLPKGMRRLEAV